jgi:hypothetical protein
MLYPRLSATNELDGDLPRAFIKVARALFDLMAETWDYWPSVSRSRPTALAGVDQEIKNPPPQIEVHEVHLAAQFVELGQAQEAAWGHLFSPVLAEALTQILVAAVRGESPRVPGDLWRASLYEASAFGARDEAVRDEAVAALAPIFLGRYLAGLEEDQDSNARQVNAQIEAEALNFETAKPELTALWRQRVGS